MHFKMNKKPKCPWHDSLLYPVTTPCFMTTMHCVIDTHVISTRSMPRADKLNAGLSLIRLDIEIMHECRVNKKKK